MPTPTSSRRRPGSATAAAPRAFAGQRQTSEENSDAGEIESAAKAAGGALAAKRGEIKVGELKGASREMYESMSQDQLEDFASTKRKGKPEHVR